MAILIKIGFLAFLSSLLHLINNISERSDFFSVTDHSWTETECIPTYGAWATKENCKLKATVSPYHSEKKCWVFDNEDNKKNKKCDIVFVEPLKTHWVITIVICLLIFIIVNSIFGGIPLLISSFALMLVILIPSTLYEEYLYAKKTKQKFSFYRIYLLLRTCSFIYFNDYNLLKNFYKYF